MADAELPPQERAEAEAAQAASEASNEQAQGEQPNLVEELARDLGWKPKEEFRGDGEWRDAADFLREGRDVQRSLNRKLKSFEDQLARVGEATSQVIADKIAERDAYWQNAHARAVEDGDQDAAKRAMDERIKLKAETPKADTFQEPPETRDFRDRNKAWFGESGNRLATARAMEIAERSRLLGASPAEQLQDAEAGIRREFPELFKANGKQAPGVTTGAARNAGQGSGKKGFADMPAESQAIAKDMLARHGVPLEDFARRYFQNEAQRKVG